MKHWGQTGQSHESLKFVTGARMNNGQVHIRTDSKILGNMRTWPENRSEVNKN